MKNKKYIKDQGGRETRKRRGGKTVHAYVCTYIVHTYLEKGVWEGREGKPS